MSLQAKFSATAAAYDLSMDARMGRKMLGLIGGGTIDVGQAGLRFTARQHSFLRNVIGGAVFAVITAVLVGFLMSQGKHSQDVGSTDSVAAIFGFFLGAWLTSLVARFSTPKVIDVDPRSITRVAFFGPYVRLFRDQAGDIQFILANPAEWAALGGALTAWGTYIG